MKRAMIIFLLIAISAIKASDFAISGTQVPIVTGDDWGCPVSGTVVEFQSEIDFLSLNKNKFTVYEKKQDYSPQGYGYMEREVIDVYCSDGEGKKVEGNSKFVTFQFYYCPIHSAFFFSMKTMYNDWSRPYGISLSLKQGQVISSKGVFYDTLAVGEDIFLSSYTIICPELHKFKLLKYTTLDQQTLDYAYYEPPEAAYKDKLALVIWNHGMGERGSNAAVPVLGNEVTALVREDFQKKFGGAFVIAIQIGFNYSINRALEIIRHYIMFEPKIDSSRIIVGGCSMGGGNTMNMLFTAPDLFAAAYPICPATNSPTVTDEMIMRIKHIPIWFIHANNDPTVNPGMTSYPLVQRLRAAGAEVHTSFFDDVHDTTGRFTDAFGNPYQYNGHWSWIYFFNNECVDENLVNCWDWLAEQYKPVINNS